MKALKSDLAKDVLADPKARDQLRHYLATKSLLSVARTPSGVLIEVQRDGKTVRLKPVVVPKAA